MSDEGSSARRVTRSYQQRRFILACLTMGFWVVCVFLAGSILGTLLFVVLTLVAVTARFVFGPVSQSPVHPALLRLRSRPWRDWEETLDVIADRLDTSAVIRTTLDGRRVAAWLVIATIDTKTLNTVATKIGLAMAEQELTGQYIKVIQTSGATLSEAVPPQVVLHGDAQLPLGAVTVTGDFRPPAGQVSSTSRTADFGRGAGARRIPTRNFGDEPTAQHSASSDVLGSLCLVLADGSLRFDPERGVEITVGKSPQCTVTLSGGDTDYTSRVHAKLTWQDGAWLLTDVSSNGTKVNGTRVIGPVPLRSDDVIAFGTRRDSPSAVVRIEQKNGHPLKAQEYIP